MAKKEFISVVLFTAVLAAGGVAAAQGQKEYSDNETAI